MSQQHTQDNHNIARAKDRVFGAFKESDANVLDRALESCAAAGVNVPEFLNQGHKELRSQVTGTTPAGTKLKFLSTMQINFSVWANIDSGPSKTAESHSRVAMVLLKHGAKFDTLDEYQSFVKTAYKQEDKTLLPDMLEQGMIDQEAKNNLLDRVFTEGNLDKMSLLLEHGAVMEDWMLRHAARQKDTTMLDLLLGYSKDDVDFLFISPGAVEKCNEHGIDLSDSRYARRESLIRSLGFMSVGSIVGVVLTGTALLCGASGAVGALIPLSIYAAKGIGAVRNHMHMRSLAPAPEQKALPPASDTPDQQRPALRVGLVRLQAATLPVMRKVVRIINDMKSSCSTENKLEEDFGQLVAAGAVTTSIRSLPAQTEDILGSYRMPAPDVSSEWQPIPNPTLAEVFKLACLKPEPALVKQPSVQRERGGPGRGGSL